jgi:hypothetical protein
VRISIAVLAAAALASAASAQEPAPPSGLATVELERSRACVDVLGSLDDLERELTPMAGRSRRLQEVAQGIALEDERMLERLDRSDPIEAQVADWFVRDQELARRYVATLAPAIVTERTGAREAIKTVITDALTAIQVEADARMEATGDLAQRAAPCDGAIFVRSAVLEACAGRSTAVCDAAGQPAGTLDERFRFVESPEAVWDVTELRPWTDPTPIRAMPNGQLDGARTVGFARMGNVVVSVSFSPLLRDRASLTDEETARMSSVNDSLGISFENAELAFAPAMGIRATLPQPLADESVYLLHFGPPETADVVWTGQPGTGTALEAAVPLAAAHVGKLQAGEPMALTAVRETASGEGEAVFSIGLNAVNQARASSALLGYMSDQLGRDLAALIRPRGSE